MPTEQEIQQERREQCRRDVREYLALRHPLAFHHRTIQARINEGHRNDFSEEEVKAAIAFLAGLGQVELKHDRLGATGYYAATSSGVLEHERGGVL